MLAPINYLLENKSPLDSFFGGVNQVQQMRGNDLTNDNNQHINNQYQLQNEATAAAQQRKLQMEAELDQLDTTDINAMRAFNARYPDMAKGVQQAYDALDAKQKQNTLLNHSRIASLVKNGRPDDAVGMLETQVEAYRNAGDEQGAQEAQSMADMIKMSPEAGLAALTWGLAIMSPKDATDNLKSITDATGKTRKEVDAGNAIYSYDIDPLTGEIGGAEFIVDKAPTPDNVLDNETSIINTTQTNQVNRDNNILTNQTSRENNITTNQTSRLNTQDNNDTSRYNTQIQAEMQRYGIDVNSANAQQKLEHERQKLAVANNQAELKEAGGKYYFVNKLGEIYPAMGPDGKQITLADKGKKPRNESQTKDYLFGSRMQEANKIVADLESKGVSRGSLIARSGSAGESIANILPSALGGNSPEQQQYIQAQRDFINAILRRESGAAIAESEFANAKKQYFAQVGDSEAVKAQKRRNRELAARTLLESANNEQAITVSGGRGNSAIDLSDLIK